MTQQWNQPADDEAQMPLGTATEGAPEADAGAPPTKKISGPTFILFGAFASALLVIYLLGMQNGPPKASAEQMARDQQANSAITDLLAKKGKADQLKGLFTNTRQLVKVFYSYLGAQKSEVPKLSHDPFGEEPAPVALHNMPHEATVIVTTNPVEAEKLRQVADEFNGLKLQSIMVGKSSMAMINNRLVQPGNKIGDLMVAAIESDRVLLSYGKNMFELKLTEPGSGK